MVRGFDPGYTAAYTPGQARYRGFKSIKEAGYEYVFIDVKVQREPMYDPYVDKIMNRVWMKEWLDREIEK